MKQTGRFNIGDIAKFVPKDSSEGPVMVCQIINTKLVSSPAGPRIQVKYLTPSIDFNPDVVYEPVEEYLHHLTKLEKALL